ncbi:MAG: PxKF domain-containing protein [Dehalococcoidia bacterium]|nr:PxKF domain-containing protein [Dehalococcoidia bacterium]
MRLRLFSDARSAWLRLGSAATILALAVLLLASTPTVADASGPSTLGRTGWEVARPYSPVQTAAFPNHGNIGFYNYLPGPVPAENDASWSDCGPGNALCPNADTIAMSQFSRLGGIYSCLASADFTFFQSLVSIPEGTTITQFSVDMSGADDGARVAIYNSANPGGFVFAGSYIYLGGSQSTTDLSTAMVAGEVNRVVITQMDDCAVGNNLQYAQISLNGTVVPPAPPLPTQTLSILGGNGAPGSVDASTDWSDDVVAWDAGISETGAWHFTGDPNPVWEPAYLVGGHPWGLVPGTNSWVNCGPTNASVECGNAAGTVVAFRVRFTIPAGSVNPDITFWINSDNAGTYYINGTQVTDRLVGGPGKGATPLPPSAPGIPGVRTAALQAALQAGQNEMLVVVEDWGGLAGFNFRADLTVQGNEPPVIVPPTPVDTTPPTVTPQVTGTLGDNDWYVSDVQVSWTVTDAESDVTSTDGCDATTVTEDTSSVTFTCSATSGGGTASGSVTLKRDATAPVATATRAPGANANGWNNTDVTVTFSGTDNLSGVASCDAAVVLGEGAGQSASGTCTDNAGNVSAPASVSGINVDKTAPVATATRAPDANANGWNNTDVTVTFSGSDALSGIDSCDAAVVLGEGAGQSASGTCTDLAGNVSDPASVSDINVDKTAPAVTVTGVADGATYTVGDVPAAGCETSDGLSGVASEAVLTVSGGPVGMVTVECAGAEDLAGNTAATSATYLVAYDFCGFKQPLLSPVQVFKIGSTVPVKFCLADASGASIGTAIAQVYANGVLQGTARYDASAGQYHFNLRTKGMQAGPLTIAVLLDDGLTHSIGVALR